MTQNRRSLLRLAGGAGAAGLAGCLGLGGGGNGDGGDDEGDGGNGGNGGTTTGAVTTTTRAGDDPGGTGDPTADTTGPEDEGTTTTEETTTTPPPRTEPLAWAEWVPTTDRLPGLDHPGVFRRDVRGTRAHLDAMNDSTAEYYRAVYGGSGDSVVPPGADPDALGGYVTVGPADPEVRRETEWGVTVLLGTFLADDVLAGIREATDTEEVGTHRGHRLLSLPEDSPLYSGSTVALADGRVVSAGIGPADSETILRRVLDAKAGEEPRLAATPPVGPVVEGMADAHQGRVVVPESAPDGPLSGAVALGSWWEFGDRETDRVFRILFEDEESAAEGRRPYEEDSDFRVTVAEGRVVEARMTIPTEDYEFP